MQLVPLRPGLDHGGDADERRLRRARAAVVRGQLLVHVLSSFDVSRRVLLVSSTGKK
jgi:hypothetical protein